MAYQLSEQTLISINPATEAVIGSLSLTPANLVPDLVKASQQAGKTWARQSLAERIEILQHSLEQAKAHSSELGRLISQEMGKPLLQALGEAQYSIEHGLEILQEAAQALAPETFQENAKVSTLHYVARGVVAVITPWNFPVNLSLNALIPALVAGNTVIYKPSENTALTGNLLGQLLNTHLPKDVLQVIHGAGDLGAALTQAPIDMVAFIGSQLSGQKILQAQAAQLNPAILEMGGKDAMVVLADADLNQAAAYAVQGSLRNSGQVCVSVERIFVEDAIAEDFVSAVRTQMASYKMGNPEDPETQMGPMVSLVQRQKVLAQLDQARKSGAQIEGGEIPAGKGYFLSPALVTGVTDQMELMREETFGPVIAIQTVPTAEIAIEKANQLEYGLGASLWSQNLAQAQDLAVRLEAGMVGINQGAGGVSGTPFVGNKKSTLGFFGGPQGLRQFAQIRVVTQSKAQ